MRARLLTADGPTVTTVGSGELDLARAASRGVDSGEVNKAIHRAIELGITLIDCADDGSERLVGDAVRALRARDRVTVVTRMPVVADTVDTFVAKLPESYVQSRVETSLRATRLDALPLVLLPHQLGWQTSPAWPELRGACARMVRDGKVMRWGALIEDPRPHPDDETGIAGLTAADGVSAVVVTYNACMRQAEPLIAAAAAAGMAVLARRVLAGGALAGALGPGVKLAPNDDRRVLTDAQLTMLAEAAGSLAALTRQVPPAAESCATARGQLERARTRRPDEVECVTLAELALRFAIDHPGVTAVLPRLHRADHVLEAIAAAIAPPLSAAITARFAAELTELLATP